MSEVLNILLSGVGGQGSLLASRMISTVALKSGKDVKSADVHGMAQRGGSVTSQIRIAGKVFSPIIPDGEVDVLVALEKLEALRYAHLVKPEGCTLINDQVITPVSVSMGMAEYPEGIDERLKKACPNPVFVDCLSVARELGNNRVSNTVLLGALSLRLDFPVETWEETIREVVKEKFIEVNLEAFSRGRSQVTA